MIQGHVEARRLLLEPGEIRGGRGGVHDGEKALRRETEGNRVVQDPAILREHVGIGALAGFGGHAIAVHALDEPMGILARNQHLAHVGNVEDAAGRAHSLMLGQDARKLHGHFPSMEIHHPPTGPHQPVEERSPLQRRIAHDKTA